MHVHLLVKSRVTDAVLFCRQSRVFFRSYLEFVGLFNHHFQLGVLSQTWAAHLGHPFLLDPYCWLVIIGISCWQRHEILHLKLIVMNMNVPKQTQGVFIACNSFERMVTNVLGFKVFLIAYSFIRDSLSKH